MVSVEIVGLLSSPFYRSGVPKKYGQHTNYVRYANPLVPCGFYKSITEQMFIIFISHQRHYDVPRLSSGNEVRKCFPV